MGYYAELHVHINKAEGSTQNIIKSPKSSKTPSASPQKSKSMSTKVVGLVAASASFINSAVGSYTGNRVTQHNRQQIITLSTLGITAMLKPGIGIPALAMYTVKSAVDFNIRQQNSIEESAYKRSYKGNMTTSGSRWKGGK